MLYNNHSSWSFVIPCATTFFLYASLFWSTFPSFLSCQTLLSSTSSFFFHNLPLFNFLLLSQLPSFFTTSFYNLHLLLKLPSTTSLCKFLPQPPSFKTPFHNFLPQPPPSFTTSYHNLLLLLSQLPSPTTSPSSLPPPSHQTILPVLHFSRERIPARSPAAAQPP